jgi:hypothetical protein
MNDDLLSQATRALRDETAPDDASSRSTRARVMASMHQSRVTRRKRLAMVIPAAATVVMATAYAAASGALPAVFTTIVHALGVSEPNTAPPPAPPRAARAHGVARPTPPPAEAVPVLPIETAAPAVAPDEPPTAARSPAPSAPREPVARPDLPDESDPGFELYRAAHRAHFVDHDPGRALPAWDAYLARTPTGRFALEARYNRALCLVRLGRHAEANAALEPFARGDYGGYRRREARDLLQAIADAG